ncbi:transcriptional repressor [Erwinia sp. S63]|uniref:Fur family transcriptional regulator n=1 Tax=Erwiniaceae TaxID=1903409 RepID=UPI00190E1A9B|nr:MULTISPECIES: transcriptional repressor [Erwiniaceae]MBK0093602.1 transcriptional repressor [Erwinia sp. S59]MBK0099340.1 transcriptional repressor [Erwinia sp. S63]MBK0127330.1 transcriptional repressor [Pantoea sp. S61]
MDKIPAHEQKWRELLRSHGLRVTSAMLATLACLEQSSDALSREELFLKLGDNSPDRVTLYRILERLMQIDVVQRFTDSARTHHFSLKQTSSMGSFECDQCRHVIPIENDPVLSAAMQLVKARLSEQGMAEREVTLASFGICSDCNQTPHS